jgi:WS/DGAT/MGAT family acyltransferase
VGAARGAAPAQRGGQGAEERALRTGPERLRRGVARLPRYTYQRLSHESAQILERETSRNFHHAGALLTFEPGPLARSDGGIRFEAIREAIEARLARVPLYRSKLRWIPLENHPVWVDDREFNLDYHLRHTSLVRPGAPEQLRQLAARVQAQRLDRSRPLWECWVVEGLEGGRFALVQKTHHALAEGNEPDLLEAVLSTDPDEGPGEAEPFRARPMPSAFELARDEVVRQARWLRKAARRLRAPRPAEREEVLRARAESVAAILGYSVRRLPETPLNGRVGPHRRFDLLTLPLAQAESVRKARGGSLDDVLLATLAGAAARYLVAHFVNPATLDFRVAVPVEAPLGSGRTGVSEHVLELPVWERDPLRQLELVRERTASAGFGGSGSMAAPAAAAGFVSTRLLARSARALRATPVNLAFASVPGSPAPLYLRGARLVAAHGKLSLRRTSALSVAVIRYTDRLCWGFNADFDLVPDLARFAGFVEESFAELVRAARPLSLARVS